MNNMGRICIPKEEFRMRVENLRASMSKRGIDAIFVYGDEYRKENLRYVSNYWPIFERGGLLLGLHSDPIVLCAPEGRMVAEEMSAWSDLRMLPEFLCVTVPDEIDYPMAQYTSFAALARELSVEKPFNKLGVSGLDAMPAALCRRLEEGFGAELVDCNDLLYALRKEKSPAEAACLREAARLADAGFDALMKSELVGKTELQAAAIAENAARAAGAEQVIFCIFGSGERTNTIVGRPTSKVIEDGDMIMCALAIQYEGYVATCEVPFAVGNFSSETRRVIDVLARALKAGVPHLKPGTPMKEFVRAVQGVFQDEGLSQYDVYPPLHGIGCAEAESPYPDSGTDTVFTEGMTVNTDISLFGLPGGSNRIEEGFLITDKGAEPLSPLVSEYCDRWLAGR